MCYIVRFEFDSWTLKVRILCFILLGLNLTPGPLKIAPLVQMENVGRTVGSPKLVLQRHKCLRMLY